MARKDRMRIALVEVRSRRGECINRDFMAGYGWAFHVGRSWPARLIETVKWAGERVPLMAYGYLAAFFRRAGHEVVVGPTAPADADLAIIHSSMVEHRAELRTAQDIRRRSRAKIGFIGPFAGARPELYEAHADFIIRGESETWGASLANGEFPSGVVSENERFNADDLPFPDWSPFPVRSYSYLPALRDRPFLPVLASRGCTFSCSYCPYPVFYRWNKRTAENVVAEIRELVDRHGLRGLLFRDPLFTADRKRVTAICEGLLAQRLRLRWACETRLDLLDERLLDTLYQAGLRVLNVAVESSDEAVLAGVKRKNAAVSHQEAMIRYCDRKGIRVSVFYVLGLPEDSEETIRRTVQYAKRLNTHVAQFFVCTPFPGTAFYESLKDRIFETNWERFDCYTPTFRHDHLEPAQILRLKEWAYCSYYYRPRWLLALARRAARAFIDSS
ncbi:MAG: radical SAM protein [Candidatus Omnitrophota bacterium]|nr:radical SAM protein [Candidatus Omnitrophota bacterium]